MIGARQYKRDIRDLKEKIKALQAENSQLNQAPKVVEVEVEKVVEIERVINNDVVRYEPPREYQSLKVGTNKQKLEAAIMEIGVLQSRLRDAGLDWEL